MVVLVDVVGFGHCHDGGTDDVDGLRSVVMLGLDQSGVACLGIVVE